MAAQILTCFFPIILQDEIAKSPCCASLGGNAFGADIVSILMVEFGTEEQKQRYLPGMISGPVRQCIRISEPDAGSDVNAITTSARGTVRISVCGRAVEHYAAMALMKRSPKMTANWALAMDHSRGGIFHSFSDRFKIR